MADEPALEPGVLAVEAYHEELAYEQRKKMLALGALLSAIGGAAIMFAVLFFGTDLFRPKPTAALITPPVKGQVPNLQAYTPDKGALGVGREALGGMYSPDTAGPKPPESNAQRPTPVAPNASRPTPNAPKNMPPFNPFAGGDIPEGWNKSGPIEGNVSVKPEGGPQTDETPDPREGASQVAATTLITGRSQGGDPETDAKGVASALNSVGGSVKIANHFSLAGSITGVQIVATFPASALSDARAKLAAQGVQIDVIQATPGQRSARVAAILNSRISDLRKDRAALEEKYLSDAPEIVQIDEEIQDLTQALGAARGANKGLVLVLVAVGSL